MHESHSGREGVARGPIYAGIGVATALILAYLLGLFSFLEPQKTASKETPQFIRQGEKILVPEGSSLRDHLAITPVATRPIGAKLVVPGIVEADPTRMAAVLTPLSGRLIELKTGLGDRVAKGQLLAIIDSPDLSQANDDDSKARDALELTEKNLHRQSEQFKIGAASARDLDQARSDHAQAAAEFARTQARLSAIGAAQGPEHDRFLSLRAPVAGSVVAITIAPGNMINDPTQALMTIADLGVVWVTALVPERDLAGIAKDQDAEVTLTAYPNQMLRGKVLFVSDVIEPDTRRNKVRIAFTNPVRALKPNMFATVSLIGARNPRIVLPTSALLMNTDRITVFVATAPWTFERRTVQVQLEDDGVVTIESGLSAGEQVVVKGGILLND